MKDIYMQMLLHLNEDFDDDLLLDSILILNQKDLWSYKFAIFTLFSIQLTQFH